VFNSEFGMRNAECGINVKIRKICSTAEFNIITIYVGFDFSIKPAFMFLEPPVKVHLLRGAAGAYYIGALRGRAPSP
jgi:hypothetical protein